jgi:hypothetical protein
LRNEAAAIVDCRVGKREFVWLLKLREAGFGDGINGWRYSHSVRFPSPELQKCELLFNQEFIPTGLLPRVAERQAIDGLDESVGQ